MYVTVYLDDVELELLEGQTGIEIDRDADAERAIIALIDGGCVW